MMNRLNQWFLSYFEIKEEKTTIGREMLAGTTTFLTMAYILFVHPAVLSGVLFDQPTGMDIGALTVATCLSAALATFLMGFYARYPVALASGMGQNFFFVLSAIPAAVAAGFGQDRAWKVVLGAVFWAGFLFMILTLLGFRKRLVDAISPNLKQAIAVGIGLFIAFIGLQNAGLVLKDPGTAVRLNPDLANPDLLLFFVVLILTAVLTVKRVPGAILWGILSAVLFSIVGRQCLEWVPGLAKRAGVNDSMLMTQFEVSESVISIPPSLGPLFLQMDLLGALTWTMLPFIIVFLFMDVFDTMGTLIGVSQEAGLLKDNQLPRGEKAMMADAVGTVSGAALGTSTVTSFIESIAGVEHGGRTGLTAVTTAAWFLLALFLTPLVGMVGSYPVVTAPALVMVGSMMIRNVARIEWKEASEAFPAFLIVLGIPFSFSIADGIALGFISYPLIKLFSGKSREVQPIMYAVGAVLLCYFLFVRSQMG